MRPGDVVFHKIGGRGVVQEYFDFAGDGARPKLLEECKVRYVKFDEKPLNFGSDIVLVDEESLTIVEDIHGPR